MSRGRPFTEAEARELAAELGCDGAEVLEQSGGWLVRVVQAGRCCVTAQIRRDFGDGWPASQVATMRTRGRL
jgi:hypothetical protein